MMRQGSSGGGFLRTGSSRCQDCGNQAKKECVYMRCRTCCKSKGFQCQTHVKSTWVPLYRRRQRQQQQQQQFLTNSSSTTTIHPQQHLLHHGHHQGHNTSSNPKRLREISSSSAGLGYDDQYEGKTLPAEVNALATFHVVRVSSMVGDEDVHDQPHHHDQYAYQTSVSIGGHLFKGVLYDQGPDHHNDQIRANYSSLGAADHRHQISGSLAHPGLLFQHPNFVNLMSTDTRSGSGSGSGAASVLPTGINFNACSSSSTSAVATDQRPLFVGSSPSTCPMFHHASTGFNISGMQFFPNRKS